MRYNRLLGPVLFGAIAVTGAFEGMRQRSYQDPGGVWTICHGETAGVTQNQSYTDEQCAMLLASSLSYHNEPLESLNYQLPQTFTLPHLISAITWGQTHFADQLCIKNYRLTISTVPVESLTDGCMLQERTVGRTAATALALLLAEK